MSSYVLAQNFSGLTTRESLSAPTGFICGVHIGTLTRVSECQSEGWHNCVGLLCKYRSFFNYLKNFQNIKTDQHFYCAIRYVYSICFGKWGHLLNWEALKASKCWIVMRTIQQALSIYFTTQLCINYSWMVVHALKNSQPPLAGRTLGKLKFTFKP